MWSLLGDKQVEVLAWESFGKDWVTDIAEELKIEIARQELNMYRKALKINKYDAEIHVGIAKALIFIGRNQENNLMIKEGINHLYEACKIKKFNNIYWWLLGSELRKNNFLNDSLSIFKQMDKYELESSINANIEWPKLNWSVLEKRTIPINFTKRSFPSTFLRLTAYFNKVIN